MSSDARVALRGSATCTHATTARIAIRRMTKIPRKLWFLFHSWVGLKLCLFMSFILLTGTLATVSMEIDWLFNASMRAAPATQVRASWGTLAENVQAAYPDHHLLYLATPPEPWFAAGAMIASPEAKIRYVYLDPETGRVQGGSGFFNVQRFLRNTHRHLMLPVKYGVPIVCSLVLLLMVSLVSSLFIYKRWWRGFLAWPRRGNRRRFWGDLHRLGGVWSLWFIALMALTGLWYMVEVLGGAAPALGDFGRPPADPEASATAPYRLKAARVDAWVAAAQHAYPRLRIEGVAPPLSAGDLLVVNGQADAMLVRARANAVGVRADTGAVVGVLHGETLGVHQRISEMADPLHFGTWGGFPTRLIWFFFGLIMTGMSLSGAYLYALRIRAAWREEDATDRSVPAPAAAPLALRLFWRGMAAWRWLALLLIAISLVLTPVTCARF